MKVLNQFEGVLKAIVSSEGNTIYPGTPVIIKEMVDNFKNLEVHVISARNTVRLSYYDTDIDWLLGLN